MGAPARTRFRGSGRPPGALPTPSTTLPPSTASGAGPKCASGSGSRHRDPDSGRAPGKRLPCPRHAGAGGMGASPQVAAGGAVRSTPRQFTVGQWPDCASDTTRSRAAATNARRALAARRVEKLLLSGRSTRSVSGLPVAAPVDLAMRERMNELALLPARAPSGTSSKSTRENIQQRSSRMTVELADVNEYFRRRLRVFPASVDSSPRGASLT